MGGRRATPPAVTDAARHSEPTGSRANIGHVRTISRFVGISIAMYFDDHGFPHFHARDASGEAKIRIDEVEVIESAMQTRQLRLVLAWAELHQDELLANWQGASG